MAHGLGRYGMVPFRLGGGASAVEQEHRAILGALDPYFDTSDTTEVYQEAFTDAVAVGFVWEASERLRNEVIPRRMTGNLATWEQACGLRPIPTDRDIERRAKLEARLRGVANNSVTDIEAVAESIFGSNFVRVVPLDPVNEITYWPGINPGPPGLEWSSNRVRVAIEVTKFGLSDELFLDRRLALAQQLDAMLPSWMSYVIGTPGSFIAGVGIVGQTFL